MVPMKPLWLPEHAPELKAFPPQQRQRIQEECMEAATGGRHSGLRTLGVLVLAVLSLGITVKVLPMLGYFGGIAVIDWGIILVPFAVVFIGMQVMVYQPYRKALIYRVREYYAGQAVPVCLNCGHHYSDNLRMSCPKCGEPREIGDPLVEERDEHGNWRL